MITKYFQSLNYSQLEGASGLYALYYGKEEWFCCAYKDKDLYKKNIVRLSNAILKIKTIENDWEFHHVIENQHLADIPLKGLGLISLNEYYAGMIPTIILHKGEPKTLSKYLHFKEFRELYFVDPHYASPSNAVARQHSANSNLTKGTITKDDVIKLIEGMIEMYRNVYVAHPAFQILSKNFLYDLRDQIN